MFAASCDKHDDDYKKKIPQSGGTPAQPEYTLDDISRIRRYVLNDNGVYYRNADRFIQGYMSVSSVKIDKKEVKKYDYTFQVFFSLDGETVKGGVMKEDPCDEGFAQLAAKYDDVYGPHDALNGRDMESEVIMTADKIEYYVYLVKGDYSPSLKEGALLNGYILYDFYTRMHKKPLLRWNSDSDQTVYTNWDLTELENKDVYLNDFSNFDHKGTDLSLIYVKRHRFNIPLPPQAGVHSFRFVAKKDGKVICDEIIEDLELPALNPVLT